MVVKKRLFAITTKNRPIYFLTKSGELANEFDDAALYEDPERIIDTLDEPEKFMPVEVSIIAFI